MPSLSLYEMNLSIVQRHECRIIEGRGKDGRREWAFLAKKEDRKDDIKDIRHQFFNIRNYALLESEIFRARVLWGKFSPPMKNRSHFFLAVLRARTCMYLADLGLNRKSINQSSLPYPFQGDLHNRITVRINQNQHSTIFRKEKIFLSPEPI